MTRVNQAQVKLLELARDSNAGWFEPCYLGIHYVSLYFLAARWCGHKFPKSWDAESFRKHLVESQNQDGTWSQIPRHPSARSVACVDATILNSWAFHVLERKSFSPASHLAQVNLSTRVWLALHGELSWDELPVSLRVQLPFQMGFGQWIEPHQTAISFFARHKVTQANKVTASESELRDLWSQRMPKGTWGGYVHATLLHLMALHAAGVTETNDPRVVESWNEVERLLLDSGSSSYLGVAFDGSTWDSILALRALLDSGYPPEKLLTQVDALAAAQSPNGGFPFGPDFTQAPDTDDAAKAVLVLRYFGSRYQPQTERALGWLLSMQNPDGGWGSFSKLSRASAWLLAPLSRNLNDSAELWDESSIDATSHVLMALYLAGDPKDTSRAIQRGLSFLHTEAVKTDAQARWACNRLFGVSRVLEAYRVLRTPPPADVLGVAWKVTKALQNKDGGFGEGFHSYQDVHVKSSHREPSGATQTAWGLSALLDLPGDEAKRRAGLAAKYLLDQPEWIDPVPVGTGHRGKVEMQYPIYPKVFPLMAIARYAKACAED